MDVDPEHEESACARIRESFLNSCMCLDDHIDRLKEKMADKFLSANYNESLMAWLRICHDFHDLEVLRNHFSINKPMSKFTWLDWLRDKIREGAERSIIEELFERAVFDINTVELWLEYVAWSIQVDDSSHKYARSKFEAAITEVGLHCMEGHRIWIAYLQFETDLLNDDPENSMQIKRLKELYLRSFKVPIWGMKGLLSQYKKQFRGVSEDIEKQFKKAQKDLDDVLNCEISMTGNMYAIPDIFAYLDVLLKIGDIPRARSLYERAVTRHPYNEDLWVAYGGWLEGLKIYAIASRVYQRSVRYLSENVALWQSCLLAMERSINQYGPLTGNEDEQDRKLSDTVEKLDALWECAKDSFQHENEGCSLYRTYGYLLRRRAVSSSDPPDYTKASEHFDYGYRYIQQKYGPKKWDHTFEYRMNFAYFCYTCLDDPAKGRFLWKDIMATGGAKHSNICIEAARAERQFGSIEQARKHLIRGLNSVTDDPSELFRFYIQFEREEGTLEQLDYALARVNSQYCMREERREKEEQKRKEEEQEEKKQKEETRKLLRAAKDSLMPAKTRGIIYVNEEESVGKPKKRAATAAPAQEFSPAKKFASIGNDDTPCSSGTLNASPAKDKDGFAMPMLPVRKQSPSPVSSGPSSPSSSSTSINGPPAITVEQANTITKPKNEAATTPFTLFIFNIDFALDPKEIADVLGGVHAVRLGQGDGPKKSNGRGFVDFVSEEARLAALAKDGIHVSGRPLRICIDDKDNRPKFKYDTEGVDKRKLFARPIPMNTTKEELRELFGVHGEIEDIRIPEKSSGHQKGVAYIDFATEEAAVNALAAEIHFKGVKLETYVSRPPPPKKSGPPPPKELPPLPEGRKTSLQMVPRKVAVARGGARGGSRGGPHGGARGGARAPSASNGGAALSNDQFRKFLAGPKIIMNGNRSWDSLRDGEDKHDSHLLAPFEYIKSMPGKQIRTKLARAFNHWMGVEESQLTHIMDIIEMIHNASLMVDDIEDGSVLRRGLPVTHSVYGVPRTINTANYVYFLALERCMGAKMDHPQTVSVFTEHILELHRGQGKELYWRDTVTVPEEAEYEMMVLQKTGGLFMLTVKLMNLYHNNGMEQKNFTNVLNLLALFFQIRDDYLNLVCEDMAAQKTLAEDLTEGKFSFPIIHAIRAGGALHNDDPILNILRQRTTSIEVKQYCIELIRQRGSFEHTLKRLREIGAEIRTETIQLGGNDLLDEIVDMLSATIPGI